MCIAEGQRKRGGFIQDLSSVVQNSFHIARILRERQAIRSEGPEDTLHPHQEEREVEYIGLNDGHAV
jgi:hypothetical protein